MNHTHKIKVKHKVWIENEKGEGLLGDGKWELLKLISEKGSLKNALNELGWGYRSTWNKLKMIENRLGFDILIKKRGGAGGGGHTVLSEKGELLVLYFNQLYADVDKALKSPVEDFQEKINKFIIKKK